MGATYPTGLSPGGNHKGGSLMTAYSGDSIYCAATEIWKAEYPLQRVIPNLETRHQISRTNVQGSDIVT